MEIGAHCKESGALSDLELVGTECGQPVLLVRVSHVDDRIRLQVTRCTCLLTTRNKLLEKPVGEGLLGVTANGLVRF